MGGQGRTSSATGDVRTHPDTLHPARRGLCARVSCSACCGLEHDMSQHIEKMWPGGFRIPTTLRLESCGLNERQGLAQPSHDTYRGGTNLRANPIATRAEHAGSCTSFTKPAPRASITRRPRDRVARAACMVSAPREAGARPARTEAAAQILVRGSAVEFLGFDAGTWPTISGVCQRELSGKGFRRWRGTPRTYSAPPHMSDCANACERGEKGFSRVQAFEVRGCAMDDPVQRPRWAGVPSWRP